MIIDDNSNNSLSFSMFTDQEIEQQSFIKQIDFLLEKYNILENDNQLIGSIEKKILFTISYIEKLSIKKETIPHDLEDLFLNNLFFKEQINIFIEKKLLNIAKNDSIYFFKDLNIILHILAIGTQEKIIDSYNNYNFGSLSNLFRFYEEILKNLFLNDKVLFDLTFNTHNLLLQSIIQLCHFNSIDIVAKKSIKIFIELMTETINILKYNILLEEDKLEKLNNIQGKYLYYFSHIDNIIFDIKNPNNTIKNYLLILEKQEQGYILSKENSVTNKIENLDTNEFLVFKKNSIILILNLLKEIKNLSLEKSKYFDDEYFQRILRFYYKKFTFYVDTPSIAQNINDFQNDLLNSLLSNYKLEQDYIKEPDYHLIIDDFLFSQENICNNNIEIIFKLLYFADDIPTYKYHQSAQILAQFKPINNDYHEFYKLEIFNLTINKSINENYSYEIEDLLDKIFIYVNSYKIASHLLSIYCKIYLSLAIFYSSKKINLQKAKNLYAMFIEINGYDILQNEYKELNLEILQNINISSDLILKEFSDNKHFELKNELINIKNKINIISNDEIKSSLVNFITNNIFHGLCETFIVQKNELTTLEIGFEEYKIETNKYIIKLVFTSLYKNSFWEIYKKNFSYITQEVVEILNNLNDNSKKFNILIADEDEIEINY